MPAKRRHLPKYGQAHHVVRLFGGACALAKHLGATRFTVQRWMTPRAAHPYGQDGLIPSRFWPAIQKAAREEGIHFTDADMAIHPYNSETDED